MGAALIFAAAALVLCMLSSVAGFRGGCRSQPGQRLSASLADRPASLERDPRQYLLQTTGVILPTLSRTEKAALLLGERVQKQDRKGHSGYGVVVLDVPASAEEVFDALTQFDRYMEMIPTVRSVKIFSSNEKNTLVSWQRCCCCRRL